MTRRHHRGSALVRLSGLVSTRLVGVLAGVLAVASTLTAQSTATGDSLRQATVTRSWMPSLLGAQVNAIAQSIAPFRSLYTGPNSLTADGDQAISHAYGAYLGVRPFTDRSARTFVDAYVDVEMVRGRGISRTVGLGGLTNGDVIRQGSADLGAGPYLARAYVRLVRALDDAHDVTLSQSAEQLPTVTSARRVEVTIGKIAASDLFDLNRYANSTRQQFMNWGLFQNTAWDFAADTRGYTNGVAVTLLSPRWSLRVGSFQMPTAANGNVFDASLSNARGDQAELTLTPSIARLGGRSPTVRVLAYVNHARMGSYADALARARGTRVAPDIVADDLPGRSKRGWGVNVEQPLADGGETGVWLRLGANDGRTESFAFTEVDRHLSAGVQLIGRSWHRAADRVAVAIVVHGLSADHRAYLAAGGSGFLLGDGRLAYASESIIEAYYRLQPVAWCQITADVQSVRNPGYNRERGPALVSGLRVNLHR